MVQKRFWSQDYFSRGPMLEGRVEEKENEGEEREMNIEMVFLKEFGYTQHNMYLPRSIGGKIQSIFGDEF